MPKTARRTLLAALCALTLVLADQGEAAAAPLTARHTSSSRTSWVTWAHRHRHSAAWWWRHWRHHHHDDAGGPPRPAPKPTPKPAPKPAPKPTPPPVTGSSNGTPAGNQALGRRMMLQTWPAAQWTYLLKLWNQESGWRQLAKNPSSGAYGIPQSLPATKMASAGADWRTNPKTQMTWGLRYIKSRYGSPQGAWAHEVKYNWY